MCLGPAAMLLGGMALGRRQAKKKNQAAAAPVIGGTGTSTPTAAPNTPPAAPVTQNTAPYFANLIQNGDGAPLGL